MRVLVTRAEDQAEETARALHAAGHVPVVAPLRRVVPLPVTLSGPPPERIVVTSGNALVALSVPAQWCEVPVIAVGEATAGAARQAGFVRVVAAAGDVRSAVAMVLSGGISPRPVVYLAGQPRKPDFERAMADAGQAIDLREAYRMEDMPGFAGAVREALAGGRIDAVLHFSAASAHACLAALAAAGILVQTAPLRHVALSVEVAAPLIAAGIPQERLSVAIRPDQAALLACLGAGTPP